MLTGPIVTYCGKVPGTWESLQKFEAPDPPQPRHCPLLSGPWLVLTTSHTQMCWELEKAGIISSLFGACFSSALTFQRHLKSAVDVVPSLHPTSWRVTGEVRRGLPGEGEAAGTATG